MRPIHVVYILSLVGLFLLVYLGYKWQSQGFSWWYLAGMVLGGMMNFVATQMYPDAKEEEEKRSGLSK